ncbi:unnamed protein product, partial [Effrenium voratum]
AYSWPLAEWGDAVSIEEHPHDPAISLEAQVLPFDQISHNIGLGEQGNFDSGEGGLLCIVNCQAK